MYKIVKTIDYQNPKYPTKIEGEFFESGMPHNIKTIIYKLPTSKSKMSDLECLSYAIETYLEEAKAFLSEHKNMDIA